MSDFVQKVFFRLSLASLLNFNLHRSRSRKICQNKVGPTLEEKKVFDFFVALFLASIKNIRK
jgi:hypothetical protein